MATHWMQIAILTIVLTMGGPVPGIAPSSQPQSDTYTWNGELVSLGTTEKTMTVKSRVAYQEAISDLKHFKGGDRVWIVWSGIHDSSDAVRQVRRPETGRNIDENLVLPAELVSIQPVPHDSHKGARERVGGDQEREDRRVGHSDVPPPAVDRG